MCPLVACTAREPWDTVSPAGEGVTSPAPLREGGVVGPSENARVASGTPNATWGTTSRLVSGLRKPKWAACRWRPWLRVSHQNEMQRKPREQVNREENPAKSPAKLSVRKRT